ncbi:MAG: hypothetical protein U9M97_04890 [Candidatus Hadarchaeota archaeon]|nr:hypothetical protein [Candidatus Hadarchaeota archaeon]
MAGPVESRIKNHLHKQKGVFIGLKREMLNRLERVLERLEK